MQKRRQNGVAANEHQNTRGDEKLPRLYRRMKPKWINEKGSPRNHYINGTHFGGNKVDAKIYFGNLRLIVCALFGLVSYDEPLVTPSI